MGTLVSITVLDASEEKARKARDSAFTAMDQLLPIFNRHDGSSHLSELNQREVLRDVPPELNRVLEQSRVLYRLSDQAFDITILPLLEMSKRNRAGSARPDWSAVQEKLALTGWSNISCSSKEIRLQPGTRITLDGIAKGFIVDRAAAVLRAHGVAAGLINAGGDIRAVGDKQGTPWQVGVRDPEGRERPVQTVRLSDLAVATSGSYERYFDASGKHHHLIDGSRGDSPRRTISSTVIAPSAMLADGLSTAFFVLQPEQSLKLAAKLNHVETHIITRGGRSFSSGGWKRISA
jgi:thiamine biosynthesis lipoprotein